ncbi:hypothetical protein BpHYR1_000686 [Brachionus plicatilis]|uniref:Uncharacterized protein n=1 Tax=Brachionus plicatilis TaxID=10195 RepID=A0A3M7T5Q4_BRAPC|nr:hypothetical protein BpHYR1_000686 [Brachionus plicatilis]
MSFEGPYFVIKNANVGIGRLLGCDKNGKRGDGCSIRNILESKFPAWSRLIHQFSRSLFSIFGTMTNFSYVANICTNFCKKSSRTHRLNCSPTTSSWSIQPSGSVRAPKSPGPFEAPVLCANSAIRTYAWLACKMSKLALDACFFSFCLLSTKWTIISLMSLMSLFFSGNSGRASGHETVPESMSTKQRCPCLKNSLSMSLWWKPMM